jgi:DNA polymerase III subunit epsilon
MRPPAPPRRTRSLPWREAAYAALDFETTGLDYHRDAIVSYGVIPIIGGRVVLAGGAHQLIRPAVPPSPRSQTVHLLRPQDLLDAPTIEQARGGLGAHLAGRYLLAWFAEVEVRFLARTFGGRLRAWRRRTIDVRNLALVVDGRPDAARIEHGYPLNGVARRYGVPVATPHEAYDDALVTAQLFLALVSKLPSGGDPNVRDLVRIAHP